MRSVNVAKLKDQLSKYLSYAKRGEEIVIRERNLPVAKLCPLSSDDLDEQETALVAAGKLRLPKTKLDVKKFTNMPIAKVRGNVAIQALLQDRDESI